MLYVATAVIVMFSFPSLLPYCRCTLWLFVMMRSFHAGRSITSDNKLDSLWTTCFDNFCRNLFTAMTDTSASSCSTVQKVGSKSTTEQLLVSLGLTNSLTALLALPSTMDERKSPGQFCHFRKSYYFCSPSTYIQNIWCQTLWQLFQNFADFSIWGLGWHTLFFSVVTTVATRCSLLETQSSAKLWLHLRQNLKHDTKICFKTVARFCGAY